MTDNAAVSPTRLSEATRRKVWWKSQFLQGSMNYERMQALGWCYGMGPALKELYPDKDDLAQALKRHLEFFNTQPFLASPIFGVEMTLEEERAAGVEVDDAAIQGVKIGMMGPLAGVGDPIFWGTIRPVLGAFCASLALSGSIAGAFVFFIVWNLVRLAFMWYTQEFGYKQGMNITKDLSGGFLKKITMGASILGMFIMGVLIPRWTSMPMSKVVFSKAALSNAADTFPGIAGLADAINGGTVNAESLTQGVRSVGTLASTDTVSMIDGVAQVVRTTTLQSVLDQLLPALLPLGLTFLCIRLLKKGVSPITIIFALFAVGILGALVGIF
ncbi:PTS system mannose/fructose/sorbose family transporter subunit IID [Olsenella massiliensis]|uniref:PTS system mannose/fructose/sorbose family transporter subunit IID n=1 Tax=Olsenella massiliensis TaxID=1622075 RepID=UPI00071C812D|nr:PTS system mannose/fructose/sorbose family transporter subunit IID [Olsenella massiliensis]